VATVGILALQGDFEAHAAALAELGAQARRVRIPGDLEALDALVIPGGESTTMTLGIEREGLAEPLREFAQSGRPVLGTCAGLIVLDREHLGLMDLTARRNAFGRQVASFEADLELAGLGGDPLRAVFIRAPWVEEAAPEVEILAEIDGHPVAVRQGNMLAVAFHPELTDDPRLHAWLLDRARERAREVVAEPAGADPDASAAGRQRAERA
jgi:5'-phosphate synthase pdxT subunit